MSLPVPLNIPESHYNAGLGRFISEDPIGLGGQDANLYRYVGNNSINAFDSSRVRIISLK